MAATGIGETVFGYDNLTAFKACSSRNKEIRLEQLCAIDVVLYRLHTRISLPRNASQTSCEPRRTDNIQAMLFCLAIEPS